MEGNMEHWRPWEERLEEEIKMTRERLDDLEQKIKEIKELKREFEERFCREDGEENEKRLDEIRNILRAKIDELNQRTWVMPSRVSVEYWQAMEDCESRSAFLNYRRLKLREGEKIEAIVRNCGL